MFACINTRKIARYNTRSCLDSSISLPLFRKVLLSISRKLSIGTLVPMPCLCRGKRNSSKVYRSSRQNIVQQNTIVRIV